MSPATWSLADVSAELASGGVVALPTDTVYGLAADARREDAVAKLFDLKARPESVALPVLVASLEQGVALAAEPARAALATVAGALWPGALTLVVERAAGSGLHLGGDPATVGLRCPEHPAVRRLCAEIGPLAVSSANRHGAPPCRNGEEVVAAFGPDLALLDGGRCDGVPSTVVSLVGGGVELLRAGPVALQSVLTALGDSRSSARTGPR